MQSAHCGVQSYMWVFNCSQVETPNASVIQEPAGFVSFSLPLSTSIYFSACRYELPHLHSFSSHKPPVFPAWLLAWWPLLPDPCLFREYCQHICKYLFYSNLFIYPSERVLFPTRTLMDRMSLSGPAWLNLSFAFLAYITLCLPAMTGLGVRGCGVLFPLPELFFLTLFTWLSSSFPFLKLLCIWNDL